MVVGWVRDEVPREMNLSLGKEHFLKVRVEEIWLLTSSLQCYIDEVRATTAEAKTAVPIN